MEVAGLVEVVAGVAEIEVEGAVDWIIVGIEGDGGWGCFAPGGVVVAGCEVAGGVDDLADAAEVVGAVGIGACLRAGDEFYAVGVEAFLDGAAVGCAFFGDLQTGPEMAFVGNVEVVVVFFDDADAAG